MNDTALLTFSIGPVHAFIAQARRVADLWTGSDLLSFLIQEAIDEAHRNRGEAIFPAVDRGETPPRGLPNRVVCRVPADSAEAVAAAMERRVRSTWDTLVRNAVNALARRGIRPAPEIWTEEGAGRRQTDPVFEVSWSWVPEDGGYAAAALPAAQRFAASRLFRPFRQIHELGEKCAICGERTALPDGRRENVRSAWEAAEKSSATEDDRRFYRLDQTRLCLVCATKRLYSLAKDNGESPYFSGFDKFQPDAETAYFALLAMDGDRMGKVLTWTADKFEEGDLEAFHRAVSRALSSFSESLRGRRPWVLDLQALGIPRAMGKQPQLVYAGGEDVMVVCDPRDALGLALAIRQRYRRELEVVKPLLADAEDFDRAFTISAGILFAHAKYPAGLAFRSVETLLKDKAKGEAGRDAVAISLMKRGGVPVDVAFKWGADDGWVQRFGDLVAKLSEGALASRQSYNLRHEEKVLREVFGDVGERWQRWLRDRLARSEVSSEDAAELASMLTPFFVEGRSQALRIARFLGREVPTLAAHQHQQPEEDVA